MAIKYSGDNITFPDNSVQITAPSGFGFKNRIINGAMMIDQRNAGASVTPNGAVYNVDRWWTYNTQASKFTIQQNAGSITPPVGFTNYVGVTSSSAYSVLSTDQFILAQWVEGFNAADLGWGTANAATVTLSFWVRSSLTGSFGGCFQNYSNNRSYPFSYTINSANTWEQKTITVAGDTTGTWSTTSTGWGGVIFSLGCGTNFNSTVNTWAAGNYKQSSGATSVVGTSGATFYITGVQLEKGSTATSFDYRPYGTELALCQRYYEALSINAGNDPGTGGFFALGVCENTTRVQPYYTFKVQKRAAPSTTLSTISSFGIRSTGSSVACSSGTFGATVSFARGEFNNAGGGLIAGGCGWLTNHTGVASIEWSAEL